MHALKSWAPAILWAVVIWLLSTAAFSDEGTLRYILPVLKWLFPHADHGALVTIHHYIRKSAHFVEYFIFGLLALRGIRGERHGWKLKWALAAVAIAASYAALDEIHQAFEPGRGPSAYDSLLDTSGATTALLLAGVHARWQARREKETPARDDRAG